MFKELSLYRVGPEWPVDNHQLREAVEKAQFDTSEPCVPAHSGWAPPREKHGDLVEVVNGAAILKFVTETRSVPKSEVLKKAAENAAKIEEETGRRPGKKEMRDLRDDALVALLPQAFPRQSAVLVWFDNETRLLAVGSASAAKVDAVVSALVREAGAGFTVSPVQTRTSPQAAMAAWLTAAAEDEDEDDLTAQSEGLSALTLGAECALRGEGEQPKTVEFANATLDDERIAALVKEGNLPTALALTSDNGVDFTLTHQLTLKKINIPAPAVFDNEGGSVDQFDANVALTTGELALVVRDLLRELGGEKV